MDRVVVTWNGKGQDPPLANIHLDVAPHFQLYLFDYSGTQEKNPLLEIPNNPLGIELAQLPLSKQTECKGQILQYCEQIFRPLHRQRIGNETQRNYLSIIDDDILISISDINRALHLGRRLNLTTFSPSLSKDSYHNHAKMLTQPGQLAHSVDWVEIMMPFIDAELFHSSKDFYPASISSWGIDCYVYPLLAITHNLGDRHAVLDSVVASHIRPVSSGDRTFSHGLTAHDELISLKHKCIDYLQEKAPSLLKDKRVRELLNLDTQQPLRHLQRLRKISRLPRALREGARTLMAKEDIRHPIQSRIR